MFVVADSIHVYSVCMCLCMIKMRRYVETIVNSNDMDNQMRLD